MTRLLAVVAVLLLSPLVASPSAHGAEVPGGLEERARIRDVMDKVVSPEVAHELLARGLALGGEAVARTG